MTTGAALCLIEDDKIMGESLSDRLNFEGLVFDWYKDGRSALRALEKRKYAAIVSDIRLPDLSGEELFRTLIEQEAVIPPTLFITGYGSIDQAVRLLRMGARDYITKPFDIDDLLERLRELCPGLFSEKGWSQPEAVLGISPVMRYIQDFIARAATNGLPLLLTGESGAGKEFAARYLHSCVDTDGNKPFQAVNCASFTENLLEAELFGYEKGAFTGSVRAHRGMFERADGGILFLDEVGDMSSAMQAKLLRVIQDGCVSRVGAEKTKTVDVRLVCATNRDLADMVRSGNFREDLFYRINVVNVHIPPLRERTDDVLWFARMFLDEHRRKHGARLVLTPAAERYLVAQEWRGNVRELRNVVERSTLFVVDSVIDVPQLTATAEERSAKSAPPFTGLKSYLERCERNQIKELLIANDWHIGESAKALGISRKNLWEKMSKYGIKR